MTTPVEAEVMPVPAEVQVLGKIIPVEQRNYEVQCVSCKAHLSFNTRHVFRTYISTWAWIWGLPDGLEIKCPQCSSSVNVKRVLPTWVMSRI